MYSCKVAVKLDLKWASVVTFPLSRVWVVLSTNSASLWCEAGTAAYGWEAKAWRKAAAGRQSSLILLDLIWSYCIWSYCSTCLKQCSSGSCQTSPLHPFPEMLHPKWPDISSQSWMFQVRLWHLTGDFEEWKGSPGQRSPAFKKHTMSAQCKRLLILSTLSRVTWAQWHFGSGLNKECSPACA